PAGPAAARRAAAAAGALGACWHLAAAWPCDGHGGHDCRASCPDEVADSWGTGRARARVQGLTVGRSSTPGVSAAQAMMAGRARGEIFASVPVTGPHELPAHLDRACVQVGVLPSQADRLGLADADRECDRPAGADAPVRGCAKNLAGLL